MSRHHRRMAIAVSMLALAPAAALPAVAVAKVKAPKDGSNYRGFTDHRRLSLTTSGKSIQIIAFKFACGTTVGSTSLSEIPIEKSKNGYRFDTTAHGIVSYMDGRPDENATIKIKGRFSTSARKVHGKLNVNPPRCDTGDVKFHAKRA